MKRVVILILSAITLLCTGGVAYAEPEVLSPSAAVIDAETGIVIYEKNKDELNYPASTTKIMTALLAIEGSSGDYESRVQFSHEAVFGIEPGSSNIAMNVGESLSLDDALYGLMLESANEVANALAEKLSGTTQAFARRMTERARELGATNTQFMNAHGLPDDEHYSTAYDMALIMREAVRKPKFVELISTRSHDIMPTELQPEIRILNNTNRMIQPHTSYYNEWVVGGKTGYTDIAKNTLVSYARRDGMRLIASVMHGEYREPYLDTAQLIEYGFTQYAQVEIFDPAVYEAQVPVVQPTGAQGGVVRITAVADGPMSRFLPKQAAEYITYKAMLPAKLAAPVAAGDRLGELHIYCNDALLSVVQLTAAEAVEAIEPAPVAESVGVSIEEPKRLNSYVVPGAAAVAVLTAALVLVYFKATSKDC